MSDTRDCGLKYKRADYAGIINVSAGRHRSPEESSASAFAARLRIAPISCSAGLIRFAPYRRAIIILNVATPTTSSRRARRFKTEIGAAATSATASAAARPVIKQASRGGDKTF